MNKIDWDKRIHRADQLLELSESEVLQFYRHILDMQRQIYEKVSCNPSARPQPGCSFSEQLDIELALQCLPALLDVVQSKGPAKLAEESRKLCASGAAQQQKMITDYLRAKGATGHTEPDSFFARALVEPCAEFQASRLPPAPGFTGSTCPICGGKPQLAVLRPLGDGGKRYLVCSFCCTEWEFRRILCPVCEEVNYANLPRYSADSLTAVRLDACDACKYFLKSFDMTVDGLLVPEVDEIATIALDLWASEQGYRKIQPNIMGF